MQRCVLVADRADNVAKTVRAVLKGMVDRVDYAADGRTALLMVQAVDYALIVLDVLLPKLGGAQICAEMRAQGAEAPILAVTACTEAIPRLLGLRAGVYEYLPKPLDDAELQRKAGALLEECERARMRCMPREPVQVGDLRIDPATYEIRVHGKPVRGISEREANVLHFLAQHPGLPFSKEQLLSSVWGIQHAIDFKLTGVNLARLRDKIRTAAGHDYLATTEEPLYRNKRYFVRPPAWIPTMPLLAAQRRRMELYGKP